MYFTKTVNSSQFRTTRINFLIPLFIKKIFVLNFPQKRCNCPSLVNVRLYFSFLNFVISLIISKISPWYISLSRITTSLPLSGLTITVSFLVHSFFKIPYFLNVFWVVYTKTNGRLEDLELLLLTRQNLFRLLNRTTRKD